jgi:hypothetical protein
MPHSNWCLGWFRCTGELVQIDGSEHWWFEDRGLQCTLLVYVDDFTSRLMHLKFVETESTFDYFHATREYLERNSSNVGEVGFAVSPRAGLSAMSTSCCWTAGICCSSRTGSNVARSSWHAAPHFLVRPGSAKSR